MISSKRKTLVINLLNDDLKHLDDYIKVNDTQMAIMEYYRLDGYLSGLFVSDVITFDEYQSYKADLHTRSKAIYKMF